MASFLSALKTRCEVHEVNGGRDFRLGRSEEDRAERKRAGGGSWFVGYRDGFEAYVEKVTGGKKGMFLESDQRVMLTLRHLLGVASSVNVYGRKVQVPWAVDKIARFTFAELCEEVSGKPIRYAQYITHGSI